MVSSSELTQTSSKEITTESLKLLSVNEARELQQATQDTVTKTTEPDNKETVIIDSEADSNPPVLSSSENLPRGDIIKPPHICLQNSSIHYDELALLSKRKARAILKIGNVTLNRLINEGNIKIIFVNEREKIPFISLQEYVYNMHAKKETEIEVLKIIDEEEAKAIANQILEEINKGDI